MLLHECSPTSRVLQFGSHLVVKNCFAHLRIIVHRGHISKARTGIELLRLFHFWQQLEIIKCQQSTFCLFFIIRELYLILSAILRCLKEFISFLFLLRLFVLEHCFESTILISLDARQFITKLLLAVIITAIENVSLLFAGIPFRDV